MGWLTDSRSKIHQCLMIGTRLILTCELLFRKIEDEEISYQVEKLRRNSAWRIASSAGASTAIASSLAS